ncbi:hypothetical protein HDU91_007441, partial [Kappamyces sp. JEL0680]
PVRPTIHALMTLELAQILFCNILGVAGYLYSHKIVPTALVEIAKIVHFFVSLMYFKQPYPTLFYLERIPESLIILAICCQKLVHLVAQYSAPFPLHPLLSTEVGLEDDFHIAIKKWGETLTKSSSHLSLSNEFNPILAPIGIGIPPSLLIDVNAKPQPFRNAISSEGGERTWLSFNSGDIFAGPKHLLHLVFQLASAALMWALALLRPIRSGSLVPDEDDEDDSDYQPSEQDEYESSLSGSELSAMDESDRETEPENLYKELFELGLDLSNAVEPESMVNPIDVYLSLSAEARHSPLRLRSRSKTAWQTTELRRVDTIRAQAPFERRMCIICHSEARCIVLVPCGCLCLCDSGCREKMASKGITSCPCCRRPVQGYRKIFEP